MYHRVSIIESERDWGRSVMERHYFDTKAEAVAFVNDYNADLPKEVPDYYIIARYDGEF